MLKTYTSINSVYYATDIVIEAKETVRIAFDGGVRYPKVIFGTYSTDNKKIQDAIEKDASYGVEFKLVKTKQSTEEKPETDSKEYPNITTVGNARAFLWETFKKKAMNRAEVLEICKDLGISFPDLNPE